jgi:hypothetical protein
MNTVLCEERSDAAIQCTYTDDLDCFVPRNDEVKVEASLAVAGVASRNGGRRGAAKAVRRGRFRRTQGIKTGRQILESS